MGLDINTSILVATLLVFILVLSLIARHFATRDVRILADIAREYGGKITVNAFNSSASLDFSHRGANMRFYQRKGLGGKASRCFLRCDLKSADALSLLIAKGISGNTTIEELKYLMKMPRIEVESENINRSFTVRGNNRSFLGALMTGDFEKKLVALAKKDPVLYLRPKTDPSPAARLDSETVHLLEFSLNDAPAGRDDVKRVIDDGLTLMRRFL